MRRQAGNDIMKTKIPHGLRNDRRRNFPNDVALINISMIIISIILILVAIITPEENSVFGHAQSRNVISVSRRAAV